MQSFLVVVIVSSLAFVATMFDNFFAFAAQLIVTDHEKFRRVAWAQGIAVVVLVALAGGIGALLPGPGTAALGGTALCRAL